MKTLQEHEDEFWKNWKDIDPMKPKRCNIACPKCGDELFADYSIALTSYPPQTPVFCEKCGYRGSIH